MLGDGINQWKIVNSCVHISFRHGVPYTRHQRHPARAHREVEQPQFARGSHHSRGGGTLSRHPQSTHPGRESILIDGDWKLNELYLFQFRGLPEMSFIDKSLQDKLISTIGSVGFGSDSDLMELVEATTKVPKWDYQPMVTLLSGRLLQRNVKNLASRK